MGKITNRKQQRKEKRKEKKVKKNEYYSKRNKPGQFVLKPNNNECEEVSDLPKKKTNAGAGSNVLSTEAIRKKEHKEQKRIQKQMDEQRKKQLLKENVFEDKNIKRLEKMLHLNKRKAKSLPKSFAVDGLDCNTKSPTNHNRFNR